MLDSMFYYANSLDSRPPPKGNWQLAEGSDTSKAVLGMPDPSKFFVLRVDADVEGKVDIRKYNYIDHFDWTEKSHIDALNKYRTQLFNRTE